MKQSNLSLKDLGDLVGCHKSFISHLLSGRRSSCTTDTADRIALALHVPTEVLFQPKMSTSSTLSDKQQATAA